MPANYRCVLLRSQRREDIENPLVYGRDSFSGESLISNFGEKLEKAILILPWS